MANSTQEAIRIAAEGIAKLKVEMTSLNTVILDGAAKLNTMLSADMTSFKELNVLLKQVEATTKKTNEASEKKIVVDGKVKTQQKELAKTFQGLSTQRQKEIKQRERQVEKVSQLDQALRKLKASEDKVSSKAMTGRMVESVNAIGKTNDELKKMSQYYQALEKDQVKQANAIAKENTERKKANKARLAEADSIERNKNFLKKQKDAVIELSRPYNKLIAQHKQAKRVLQDLTVSQGKNSRETKKAQREYDRLTKKVNQANGATKNFAKGGLRSSAIGIRNLLGAFGIIGGVQLFANAIRQGFNLARQLDSLNFTMKAVIENEEVLSRTQLFLNTTAEKYGASILTLTERYNKFYTAARQSGVTLKDTENIFKSFTKSAGFLGLRSHELEGVFLALEQMLSKGKVTTEELRRQLGERLPGAFGVMAQTVQKLNPDIEVTVATLDKMLRAGTILSAEVLPEFAKQYEKSIGIEQKERVETLNASIERMTNSWVSFVGSITKSDGVISKVLINSIDLVTKFVSGLNLLNQTQEQFNDILENKSFLSQTKYYKELGKDSIAYAKIDKKNREEEINRIEKQIKFNENLVKLYSTDYPRYYKLSREHNKDTTKAMQENEGLNNSLSTQLGLLKAANNVLKESSEVVEEETDNRRTLGVVLKEISDLQAKLNESTKEESKDILAKIVLLDKEAEAWAKLKRKKVEGMDLPKVEGMDLPEAKGVDESIFDLISKTKDELGIILEIEKWRLSTMKGTGMMYLNQVDKIKSIEGLMSGMPDNKIIISPDNSKTAQELVDKLKELENLKDIFSEVTDTFADMFDIDMSKFDFLFDGAKNSVEDWAKLSKELIGSVLDASLQSYEIELQEAQIARDTTLNNDLASDEQKEAARKQFDEKERDIKTRKAKEERKNALIKIAVDTAVGVAMAHANYLSNPLTAPALPVILPFIIGAGLAQAAAVASQPLPKFEKGTGNAPEGMATTDEKGAEIHTDRLGNIKDLGSNQGARNKYLEKGDKIFTADQSKNMLEGFDANHLQRAIFDMNMISNGNVLNDKSVDRSLLNKMDALAYSNEKVWGEVKKLASRPINVNNKVEIKQDRAY